LAIAHSTTLTRALAAAGPRRTLLTAVAGGLLAIRTLANGGDAEARTNRKRNKNRNKNKNKNKKRNRKQKNRTVVRADATCAGPGNSGLDSTDGNSRLAQTFTAITSGPLTRAELAIVKQPGTNGEYIVRMSPVDGSGVPANEVLAATSLSNLSVPDGASIAAFTFASPASAVAGATYGLVLTRPGSSHLQWDGVISGSCPGRSFVSTDQSAPFGAGVDGIDLIFTTFVNS